MLFECETMGAERLSSSPMYVINNNEVTINDNYVDDYIYCSAEPILYDPLAPLHTKRKTLATDDFHDHPHLGNSNDQDYYSKLNKIKIPKL